MLRACASINAIACSATDRMFDVGALTTITPRSVAAVTSTLSSPTPARPTTWSDEPAASTSAVTCVAERMISACGADDRFEQLLGAQPLADVHLVTRVGEQVEPALRDLLRYQYPCHRGGSPCSPRLVWCSRLRRTARTARTVQSCASANSAANRVTPSTMSWSAMA